MQRARLAHKRHPDLGQINGYCFYATKLRFRDLAFDVGANHGEHTARMLNRGARVVAIEPQPSLAANLRERLPDATVLAVAVGDTTGEAKLHLAQEGDQLASLDASWAENCPNPVTWEETLTVPVKTLDELIDEHGCPTLVKIDTEGFDHRVLEGLSQPVDHVLFETNATIPEGTAAAFARLEALGRYHYYWAPHTESGEGSWLFCEAERPEQILARFVGVGDVYARRIR
jgi:FkbM family methyltransferase